MLSASVINKVVDTDSLYCVRAHRHVPAYHQILRAARSDIAVISHRVYEAMDELVSYQCSAPWPW